MYQKRNTLCPPKKGRISATFPSSILYFYFTTYKTFTKTPLLLHLYVPYSYLLQISSPSASQSHYFLLYTLQFQRLSPQYNLSQIFPCKHLFTMYAAKIKIMLERYKQWRPPLSLIDSCTF